MIMSTQVTPDAELSRKILASAAHLVAAKRDPKEDWSRRIVIGGKVQLGNASGRIGPGRIPCRLQTDWET
jgi:hypothetical protein